VNLVLVAILIIILAVSFIFVTTLSFEKTPLPTDVIDESSADVVSTILTTSTVPTTQNLKVAFIGDQGSGNDADSVLHLISSENADMVLHQGDFDYSDDPDLWDDKISLILGEDYPYFASIGNHDVASWDGYQQKLSERLSRVTGADCSGDLGINSSCNYMGLFFVLSGVGTMGDGHASFIENELSQTDSIWKICSWHKNMKSMQLGKKNDSTGWDVYEQCRINGAIIATGHEHSYARTKSLSDIQNQIVHPDYSDQNNLVVAPGTTFVFVSGLGGTGVRDQNRCLPDTYPYGCNGEWANIYSLNQDASPGALFCTFYADENPTKASCYFKDIAGNTPDTFSITNFPNGISEK